VWCSIGHAFLVHTCQGNFRFLLLARTIESWEFIPNVRKKDIPQFAGKTFILTDQRYSCKIAACLLAR